MKKVLCIFVIVNLMFIFSACEVKNSSSNSGEELLVTSETASYKEKSSQAETQSKKPPVQSKASSKTVSKTSSRNSSYVKNATSSATSSTKRVTTTSTSSVRSVISTTTTSKPVSSKKTTTKKGTTYTGLPVLSATKYKVLDPLNSRGLSTKSRGFSFGVAKNGEPHSITVNNQATFDKLKANALAWDNKTKEKVLYLTFDCGYPYKNLVPRILNTLKSKKVNAAFFVTMQYLEQAPTRVARMINEGHIVGNHTVNHPVCTTISRKELANELLGVDNYLRTKFGYKTKYFRYPTGAYSEDTLDLVKSVGYRSVFWSIAHADWDPKNQPGEKVSFETVTSRLHSGAVILLHSTSPDNVEILGRFIDYARSKGYVFKTLDEYEFWID